MSVVIHAGSFIRAMKELKQDITVEIPALMNWQMAVAVQNIMVNIGVKLDEGLGGGSAKLGQQKTAIEERIKGQLERLFEVPEDSGWALGEGYAIKGDTIAKKGKEVFFIDAAHRKTYYGMPDVHKANRRRFGQITGSFPPVRKGNKMYTQRYVVTKDDRDKYIKFVQAHIGRTKASFSAALDEFTARSGGYSIWQPPAWVRRHGHYFGGTGSQQFNPRNVTGTWTLESNIPWASDLQAQGKADFAVRMRERDIVSGRVLSRLIRKIEKNNSRAA